MLTVALAILVFALILAVLVLVHEAGHFATAKAAGVRVLEFGLGFPPRLWGVRFRGTLYTFNAIPLGGFVKMVGEEDPSEPGSLAGKSSGIRFLVMAAGPFMNALVAFLLFSALFMIPQEVVVGQVRVMEVAAGSPAQGAGILPGDIIVRVDGHAIDNFWDLRYRLQLHLGAKTTWLVHRAGQPQVISLVSRFKPPPGQGATGIVVNTLNPHVETRAEPAWRAPILGAQRIGEVLLLVKNEFTKWLAGGGPPEVAGPVGMAQAAGEVAREEGLGLKERALVAINLAAIVSLSLAIFNILPIPALDGGRIFFVIVEWARRGKRIPPEKEGLVHLVGFALLITLAIIITLADLNRLLRGESLLGG